MFEQDGVQPPEPALQPAEVVDEMGGEQEEENPEGVDADGNLFVNDDEEENEDAAVGLDEDAVVVDAEFEEVEGIQEQAMGPEGGNQGVPMEGIEFEQPYEYEIFSFEALVRGEDFDIPAIGTPHEFLRGTAETCMHLV